MIAVLLGAKLQYEELGRHRIDPYIPFQPVRYDVKVMLPPLSLAGLTRCIFKRTVERGGPGVQTNQGSCSLRQEATVAIFVLTKMF
ncbi:MAG TPA: hypothetical protein VHV10_01590, partial [Ktedonobacteraceae bacterium]|nr:hypothetical protein [Ktedonobacteraceae bacterium]